MQKRSKWKANQSNQRRRILKLKEIKRQQIAEAKTKKHELPK